MSALSFSEHVDFLVLGGGVAGRADRGVDFHVQTIFCRDCKQIYDAVTRLRVSLPNQLRPMGLRREQIVNRQLAPKDAPNFADALSRLPVTGNGNASWVRYPLRCPVSPLHKVEAWTERDKCPRCAYPLEKNPLPYRIWE